MTRAKKKTAKKAATRKLGSRGSVDAIAFLEKRAGGPLTFARAIQSVRLGEEESLKAFAARLGISAATLRALEKGRPVSVERAAEWARILGYHVASYVALALQSQVDAAGLKYRVSVSVAKKTARVARGRSRRYVVDLEQDETGTWVATIDRSQGVSCVTQGRTLAQARKRIRDALGLYLDDEKAAASAELVERVVPRKR